MPLSWSGKPESPKPIGKGKITVNKSINIEYELVKEAVVEIRILIHKSYGKHCFN